MLSCGGNPVTKRLLFFAYGVASYLIFLVTFLYAVAFVGGFLVPTRLEGPLEGSLAAALAINGGSLTIFAVQHSVMARRWFKERWTRIVPWTIERSTYVLCASLALLLLFWQWRPTMTLAHLVFALATTAYILLAIQFEERDLVAEHGPSYEDYRRRVPMLVPGLGAPASAAQAPGSATAQERR
jgi:protein-S-isoprenylcysteine O-methyltransferase Ste14